MQTNHLYEGWSNRQGSYQKVDYSLTVPKSLGFRAISLAKIAKTYRQPAISAIDNSSQNHEDSSFREVVAAKNHRLIAGLAMFTK